MPCLARVPLICRRATATLDLVGSLEAVGTLAGANVDYSLELFLYHCERPTEDASAVV